MSVFRMGRRGLWVLCACLGLISAGCEDSCEQLRTEACVVQETGAAECTREAKSGASGPRESVCERALILYRSQEQN